ncbi:MAG: hypothetical protein HXY30_02290, partial [Pseudorhodoplanes sp.]|nr:hypothetical protein [Pseudorhodoplanes sp.]
MHIAMVVLAGLIFLALFVGASWLMNKPAQGAPGANIFIWFWLAASVANGVVGVVQAGIPILGEIGAFIPIFGIPAALAWLYLRR